MANEGANRPLNLLITQCSENKSAEEEKGKKESEHDQNIYDSSESEPQSGTDSNFILSPEEDVLLNLPRNDTRRISDGSRSRSASAPLSLQATAIAKELLKVSEKLQVSYEEYKKLRTEVKKRRRRTISSMDSTHLTRKRENAGEQLSWWRNLVGSAPPPEEGTPV